MEQMVKMNEILSKLKSLLANDYYNKGKNVLEEHKVGMTVPISNIALPFLSNTFDKDLPAEDYPKGLFPFFSKNKGVHSMCDYMLFSYFNNKLYILLVELKHGSKNVLWDN